MDCVGCVEKSMNLAQLTACLTPKLENFGVSNFTMIGMVPEHEGDVRAPKMLIGRNPDGWAQNYRDKKYYNIDPTIHTSLASPHPFSWSDIERGRMSKEARELFADARDAMPIEGGLVIPTHDEEGCAGLLALYHEDRVLTEDAQRALKLIAFVSIERAKELHLMTEKMGIVLCPLTQRQREILSYVAEGKSDWDIGIILSIASSTVNEHIEKAKETLGVKTRAQAVALAVKRGWISL